jgi:hypothetical protein
MPTPTPTSADPTTTTLGERVHAERDELTVLMAESARCEDITSGLGIGVSDRRVKSDIVAVDWSR